MKLNRRALWGWSIFALILTFIFLLVPPAAAHIYFIKGKQSANRGRYRSAVADYRRAIRLKPNMERAYVDLGDAYLHLQRRDEAIAAFREALKLRDDSCAHCGLGWAYHDASQYEQSLAAFRQGVRADERDACSYKGLGRDYYDLGQYQESVEFYAQAARLEPRNASTRYALALAQLGRGDREAALEQYEALKTLDRDWAHKLASEINSYDSQQSAGGDVYLESPFETGAHALKP